MQTPHGIALGVGLIILALLLTLFMSKFVREKRQRRDDATVSAARIHVLEAKLKPVSDLDVEIERLTAEVKRRQMDIDALRASYADKKAIHDQLIQQVAIFDEKLSFAEMGVYEPHFDFTDSEEYKQAILDTRELQKKDGIRQNCGYLYDEMVGGRERDQRPDHD